ncbi:hypothetical protein [Marinimicrobium locisalis]|uniref:hypothetical protein n=1 Tax=Marinimicrobium locisalis TaxID=546022 RepID=UPI0032220E40
MTEIPSNLDTILHIGTGNGEELPAYLESDAKRILLVEPNPHLAEQLSQRTQGDSRVQVIERAITGDSGLNQLNEYNLPEASSLYPPTGLRQLFPGLRIIAQHPVTPLAPEELVKQFGPEEGANLLILQAPGAELDIIRGLANSQKLGLWSDIWLTASDESYYEGASPAETVIGELKRHGYDVKSQNTDNHDWPQWHLVCNPMARKVESLKLEKQALTDALQQSKNELEYTKASVNTVKEELAQARKEFDQEQSTWQTQKEELSRRLDSAMQHSSEADNTVANLQERELELGAALNQANAMVRQLREELDATREELGELKTQQAQTQQTADKNDKAAQQALEQANAKVGELEKQLESTRHASAEQREQAKQSQAELEQQLKEAREGKNAVEQENQGKKREVQQLQEQCERLKQEAQEAEKTRQDLATQHEKDARALTELNEHLTTAQKAAETHKHNAESAKAEAEKALKTAEQASSEAKAQRQAREQADAKKSEVENHAKQLAGKVKTLEEQLAEAGKSEQQFTKLQQRMEHLFDQQGLQLEQATNALGRHVTSTGHNTARELEAGFQLQQQLGPDFPSMAERGNRLPSTVALQLARQLKNQPYDLIIEMGSGVTTSFLAHTLRKRVEDQGEGEAEGSSVARYVEPSDDDLPKRILCFEHNRSTVNTLQGTLKHSGLYPIITLQYAPLVACQHQGQEYLYYDCGSRLRQIAQLFENRTAKIFVLLNDVGGDGRPNPVVALPQLLQYLSAHSLDVVVNAGEKDAGFINQWQQLLDSRGLEYQPAASFGNSSTKMIRVNP